MATRWMTRFACILALCLLTLPIAAQDETPYDIALQQIEEAAASEAKILDLSYLGLTSLPPEIKQLTSLKELWLGENQLSTLPPEIGQLTNLQSLVLDPNQLSSLPPEIGALTNLRWLQLYGNQLESLPPEIGQLTNLQFLSLHSNQLTSLPPEIRQLENLSSLYLGHNQLTNLPTELGWMETLSILEVEGNPIQDPPPEVVAEGWDAIKTYLNERAESQAQFTRMVVVSVVAIVVLLVGVRFGWFGGRSIGKKKKKRG